MPDPATSVTPAARNVRPKKLRFISGISFTYSLVMSVPSVALSVSSSGAVVVTSIVLAHARRSQSEIERSFLIDGQHHARSLRRPKAR